jgi:hypothetical protein
MNKGGENGCRVRCDRKDRDEPVEGKPKNNGLENEKNRSDEAAVLGY